MKKSILFAAGFLLFICLAGTSVYAKDNPALLAEYFSESFDWDTPSIARVCERNGKSDVFYLNEGYKAEYGRDGQIYAVTDEGKIQLTDADTNIYKAFGWNYSDEDSKNANFIFVIDNIPYLLNKKTIAFKINNIPDDYPQNGLLAICFENGRPLVNGQFHGLFETDENGIYNFENSVLRDELLDFVSDYLDGVSYTISFPNTARHVNWNQKRYRDAVNMTGYKLLREFNFYPDADFEKILNRELALDIPIGGAVSDVYSSPNNIIKGKFVSDKKGGKKYYCEEITLIHILRSSLENSSVAQLRAAFLPDDVRFQYFNCLKSLKYDITVDSQKNQYLKDYALEIDDSLYFFNKKGKLVTSKWIKESELASNAGNYHVYSDVYVNQKGQLVTNKWINRSGKKVHVDENGIIERRSWVKGPEKKMVWVDENGYIDPSRTPDEYETLKKLEKIWNELDHYSCVGICSTFRNYLVNKLYGKNASAKEYKYDWDKIKIGDRVDIYPANAEGHTGIIIYKDADMILLFDSNENRDELPHYGDHAVYRQEFETGSWVNYEKAVFHLYRY